MGIEVQINSTGGDNQSVEEKSPEELARARQEMITNIRLRIESELTKDLEMRGETERIQPVPVLFQEYGTDCAIAIARMALVYYGEGQEDMGTDGFVKEAEELGMTVPQIVDAKGEMGPQGDIDAVVAVLGRHGVKMGPSSFPLDAAIVNSLKRGELISLSINYHTLHPDESTLNRNHAVLAKGYRLTPEGKLHIVVNDPKPDIGGEIELTDDQFTETLEKLGVTIIRK